MVEISKKPLKAKKEFSEDDACSILKQIADSFVTLDNLHVMNSKGNRITLMHRDIKPANILFHKGTVKVADFGFAKMVDDVEKDAKKPHSLLGTPLYMAPQILNDEKYCTKCDIWSTGVLFYEILFNKLPWTASSVPSLYSNIKSKPLLFPKAVSAETKDLITRMLKIKEEDRITWREVYDHPCLRKFDVSGGNALGVNSMNTPLYRSPRQSPIVQPSREGREQLNVIKPY